LELAKNLGVQGIRLASPNTAGATWPEIAARLTQANRRAVVARKTKETDIHVEVNLDRESPIHVLTGIGFFARPLR